LRADCHREQGKEFVCRRRFREPRIGLLVHLHRGGVAAADVTPTRLPASGT